MNINKMEAGPEMNAKVATEVMGLRPHVNLNDGLGDVPMLYPKYSTHIAAAWQVDKPEWLWEFFESTLFLQVTLYPTKDLFHKRPWDMQPIPKGIIIVKINWESDKTKEEIYALGRCRAALKAVAK